MSGSRAIRRLKGCLIGGGHLLPPLGHGGAPFVEALQPRGDCGVRGHLHWHVDGRVDPQPALVHALPPEPVNQFATHLLLEVLAVRLLGSQTIVQHRPGLSRGLQRGGSMLPASAMACSTTLPRRAFHADVGRDDGDLTRPAGAPLRD